MRPNTFAIGSLFAFSCWGLQAQDDNFAHATNMQTGTREIGVTCLRTAVTGEPAQGFLRSPHPSGIVADAYSADQGHFAISASQYATPTNDYILFSIANTSRGYTSGNRGTPARACPPDGMTSGLSQIKFSNGDIDSRSTGNEHGSARDKGIRTTPRHPQLVLRNLAAGEYFAHDTTNLYTQISNAGVHENSCDAVPLVPQIALSVLTGFRQGCTGSWSTGLGYFNNAMNDTVIVQFIVDARGLVCAASVNVCRDDIRIARSRDRGLQARITSPIDPVVNSRRGIGRGLRAGPGRWVAEATDAGSHTQHSPIVEVVFGIEKVEIRDLYPNPAANQAPVPVVRPEAGWGIPEMRDMRGTLLYREQYNLDRGCEHLAPPHLRTSNRTHLRFRARPAHRSSHRLTCSRL